MGAQGIATSVSTRPCPALFTGPGRIGESTTNSGVLELRFDRLSSALLQRTMVHPFPSTQPVASTSTSTPTPTPTPAYISPYPSQWLFTPTHLTHTPSSLPTRDPIPLQEELDLRKRGVELIVRIAEYMPKLDPVGMGQEEVRKIVELGGGESKTFLLQSKEYQEL